MLVNLFKVNRELLSRQKRKYILFQDLLQFAIPGMSRPVKTQAEFETVKERSRRNAVWR